MEAQSQDIVASGSPPEVPNDPGKMFIGGLSWQTSPGKNAEIVTDCHVCTISSGWLLYIT
ncbi:RNA-binding protein Musashi homolog Rbp6-like [Trichogramma pretiosum]|uniref:RNA-binding protein Musashi homolog Rbp6-like n=1 Tax=Trichogramma pretiosum TaxID=7493 RepID=UPI000C719956|nr:RNA-binding protein Musashi homolog Rbp6-like [Trichogramma pretiosum]